MNGAGELIFSPTEFVALFNQTLEYAYPRVVIEGELANFKVAKNRWVYFDVKDEHSSVGFFGTVYQLPGPLKDGLKIRAIGAPRMHPRFGFRLNLASIMPIGEGSIMKAADLVRAKLEAEGLFSDERKRLLPEMPASIGLITARESAAAADFIKTLNGRWGGVEVALADCLVQGEQAPLQIVEALEHLNQLSEPPELIVITRGGGSADDLAAFNDERVVRAVAASRTPTVVAIGHEVDISLAELAADVRASTPTQAAQLAVPDRRELSANLELKHTALVKDVNGLLSSARTISEEAKASVQKLVKDILVSGRQELASNQRLIKFFDPLAVLRRGYAVVTRGRDYVTKAQLVTVGDELNIKFHDGTIGAVAKVIDGKGPK